MKSFPLTSFPLTAFLIALMKMTRDQIVNASADRAADRYGISRDHAAGYITMERGLRVRPAQGELL